MSVLAGPVWAALALLIVAGAPKTRRPYDTMRALRLAGLRVPHLLVRIFGGIEALVGLGALLTGDRVLLAIAALSYLGFAGFVVWALRQDSPLSSCGCFGKADTPPTRLHLVIVLCCAAALAVAAVRAPAEVALLDQFVASPGVALVAAGFAAVICWLAYIALTLLPAAYVKPVAARTPSEQTRNEQTGNEQTGKERQLR